MEEYRYRLVVVVMVIKLPRLVTLIMPTCHSIIALPMVATIIMPACQSCITYLWLLWLLVALRGGRGGGGRDGGALAEET